MRKTPNLEEIEANFGQNRIKSSCLLLPSQIQLMECVFKQTDKYHDKLLKRSVFLMALRTDNRIVDFINADAVKVATFKPKVLTVDQVFTEIERDEIYEALQQPKTAEQVNHKDFITWKEFIGYFEDY